MAKEPEYGVPDEENPEWTTEEIRTAKSFTEMFPGLSPVVERRGRGPQKTPRKHMVSLRLDVDVLNQWRATGKGWQSRVNDTLARHAPKPRRAVAARKSARPTAAAKRSR
jgi:uncharacterized protein (DUF4415 family)